MNELRALPMRASCLSTHTTLPDLTPYQRSRVMRYFHDAIDGLPELRDIVALVEAAAPKYTRVKELIESVEAFKLLLAFLATAEHAGGTYNEVETFFDLACGHGLVGVLVAYAFPSRRVVACDRVRRRAFDVYVRAFGAFVAAEDAGTPPPFSHVVEGSPSDETPDASGMGTMKDHMMTSALNLSTKLQSNAFPPANTTVTVSGWLFFLISFGSPHVLRAYMAV